MNMNRTFRASVSIALATLLCGAVVTPAEAKDKARTSVNKNENKNVNRNTNVNKNTNVNRNTNVNKNTNVNVNRDRDIDIDVDVDHHGGCCYHSSGGAFVAGAVVGAAVTAAVVGTRVNTLPPSCTVMVVNGIAYQQCGGVYYQPQFVGTTTTYMVVNQPM